VTIYRISVWGKHRRKCYAFGGNRLYTLCSSSVDHSVYFIYAIS